MFPNANRNSFFVKFVPPARPKILHFDAVAAELEPQVHDALYFLKALRGQIGEWSILDGLPLDALWPLQLALCEAVKHVRSRMHVTLPPPCSPPCVRSRGKSTRHDALRCNGRCFGCLGSDVCCCVRRGRVARVKEQWCKIAGYERSVCASIVACVLNVCSSH